MKNIICVLVLVITVASCKEEIPKDYVTLSGTITNQNSDSLIVQSRAFRKKINVNVDGTFLDTLKIENGDYRLSDGTEGTAVYLQNGYDLKITLNTKEFDETLKYEGIGEEANNYLAKTALLQENIFNDTDLFNLENETFDLKIENFTKKLSSLLISSKNLDSIFVVNQQKNIEGLKRYLKNIYEEKQYLATVLAKGNTSPKFVAYENYAGGNTSLDDLKGKYVYIDLWATWCGPCKAEIPFLKEIEKEYHGKNIEFVSISVDRQKDYEAWKKMIVDKELSGIQLYAKQDKTFMNSYKVSGIPRFLLIDPNGNIVSPDAPRPSDEKLKELFNSLSI